MDRQPARLFSFFSLFLLVLFSYFPNFPPLFLPLPAAGRVQQRTEGKRKIEMLCAQQRSRHRFFLPFFFPSFPPFLFPASSSPDLPFFRYRVSPNQAPDQRIWVQIGFVWAFAVACRFFSSSFLLFFFFSFSFLFFFFSRRAVQAWLRKIR